ncbi:MAG: hypothetical protein AB1641_13735 [Thermodesulfobacteriota bacterium]
MPKANSSCSRWFMAAAAWIMVLAGPAESTVRAEFNSGRASELINRLAQDGATPQTLWNLGFVLYYENRPSRELALSIAQCYDGVTGLNEAQNKSIKMAVRYWRGRYEHWDRARPVAWMDIERDYYYRRVRGEWESSLSMPRPRAPSATINPRTPRPGLWGRHR